MDGEGVAGWAGERPAWQQLGVCRGHDDPDVFHDPKREAEATAVCRGCPVRQECLVDALERGDTNGVWGGTSETQRKQLVKIARMLRDDPAATVSANDVPDLLESA